MFYIIVSFITGFALGFIFFYKKPVEPKGTIRIDKSDPDDGPFLFLELESKIDDLKHGDTVNFKVNTQSYISHD